MCIDILQKCSIKECTSYYGSAHESYFENSEQCILNCEHQSVIMTPVLGRQIYMTNIHWKQNFPAICRKYYSAPCPWVISRDRHTRPMCFLVFFCAHEHCLRGRRDIKTLERQETFKKVYLCLQARTHVMINKYGRHLFCDHIWSFDLYVLTNLIMKTFSLVFCYVYTLLFSIQYVIVCMLFSLSTQHWVA